MSTFFSESDLHNPESLPDSTTLGELREMLRVKFPHWMAGDKNWAKYLGNRCVGMKWAWLDEEPPRPDLSANLVGHPHKILMVRWLLLALREPAEESKPKAKGKAVQA